MDEPEDHKEGTRVFKYSQKEKLPKLISVIGDNDTCVGFLLAGIGEVDKERHANFFVVDKLTPKSDIEESFKRFVKRPDIEVIIINKYIADIIRTVINAYHSGQPAVLEIPSQDFPYAPEKDEILKRARSHFYSDDTVS